MCSLGQTSHKKELYQQLNESACLCLITININVNLKGMENDAKWLKKSNYNLYIEIKESHTRDFVYI